MKCFRVFVHGVTREATEADPDGAGFYTYQWVRAENQQHAIELAFQLVRGDERSTSRGGLVGLGVEEVIEADCWEVGRRYGYVYHDKE